MSNLQVPYGHCSPHVDSRRGRAIGTPDRVSDADDDADADRADAGAGGVGERSMRSRCLGQGTGAARRAGARRRHADVSLEHNTVEQTREVHEILRAWLPEAVGRARAATLGRPGG